MKKLWIMLMATICVGMAQAQTWKHIVSGGNLEDENTCLEVQCNTEGYVVEKGYPAPVAGAGMDGTKGIAVVSPASSTMMWDPQMWIVLSEPVTEGERIKVDFDYKATMPMNVPTNFQNADEMIYDGDGIGMLGCNEEWQHFSQTISLPSANQWVSASDVSRICFLLGNMDGSRTENVTFYIDNVSVLKLEYENAEVTGECGVGLKWSFNQATGVLTIDGEGTMKDYPYGVTDEGYVSTAPWYAYNEEIRSIRVNEGVTSIGNFAFMDLPYLANVKLPSTLTTLGGYAFWGCTSLKNITLPESVSKLGIGTFMQCGLTYINLPWRITSIPDQCFNICGNLQSISFSPNISRIGDKAFAQCQMMQYISLPASLETIGNSAFYYTGLKSVVIPKIVQGIGEAAFYQSKLESVTFEGCPEQIGQQTFTYCQNLTEVILPDGFTTIPYAGFMMCTSLTDIVLPSSVTNIESAAFMYCPIQSVTCLAPEPPTCGTDVFDRDTQTYMINAQLFVPQGTYDAYYNDDPWGFFQPIEELEPEQPEVLAGTCGENVTWSIDREAWTLYISGTGAMTDYGYSDSQKAPWSDYGQYIGHVVIGEGVTTIGDFAFRDLATTLDFTLPEGIESIGMSAFWRCASMESITLPSTLKAIQGSAFVDCSNLQSIVIPEGVKSIADQAFGYCTALETVTLPSTLESIGARSFSNCESLKEIVIPANVKSIGTYAFGNCVALSEITLPESLRSIDDMAFSGCTALHEVTCLGSTPAGLSDKAFDKVEGADYIAGTLHVPDGAVGAYMKDNEWRKFYTILPQSGNDPNDIAEMDYTMYVKSLTLKRGEVVELPIMVKNAGELKSIEGQLILPEGLTLEGEDIGEIEYTLNEDRWQGGRPGYGIPCAIAMEDRPTIYVDNRMGFWQAKQEDSPLMTVRLKADPDMKGGTYEGSVNYNINDYTRRGTLKFVINVEKVYECTHIQGDVNGDGKVSIADVNRLVEILMKLKIEN